jgi:type I restriction enzyme S subunit
MAEFPATDVPAQWARCEIGDVTLPVSKVDQVSEPDKNIRYIDISSIDNALNKVSTAKAYSLGKAPSRARQVIRHGDVLFSTVRPYLRNIAPVPKEYDGQVASTGFAVLRSATGIVPEFLFYKTISRGFVDALSGEQYGVSYPAVQDRQVRKQPIDVPPTNEQECIVAKIEELFSELDKGIESLKTARKQLKAYRQAVLKHAFEGKLTADWRAANTDKPETREELLARINTEREVHYQDQGDRWKVALKIWEESGQSGSGKRPTRPSGSRDIASVHQDTLEELPELPESFTYTYLGNLGDLGRGQSRHRPRNAPELFGGSYPFIQTGEIKSASRTIESYSQTYNDVGLAQSKLWPNGTLCITIAANIAETAFLGFDACFPDSVVGFTANKRLVLPEFVELFVQSVQARVAAYAPATAQKNINLSTLENLLIPYCSLTEQKAIVNRVAQILSVIEKNELEIEEAVCRADALRQSILKKAFSGRLVPQDPNDEPASVLLDRIRAERAVTKSPRRVRKSRVAAGIGTE